MATSLLAAAVALAGCAGGGANDQGQASGAAEPVSSSSTAPPTVPSTTTTTVAPTTTTRPAPQKVLLLGDSTMVDAAPGMTAMFEATGADVASAAGPGLGLTRIGLTRDPSPFREVFSRAIAEEQPDLIVVMLGSWDLSYVEEHGTDAYATVVDEAMGLLADSGAAVLWLALPPGGPTTGRVQNTSFLAAVARHPGSVFYLDYEMALRAPAGGYPVSYAAWDGSTVHLRKSDDWHFCPDGAERLAAEVNALASSLGLMRPAPEGWRDGGWRSSPLYDDPACG